MKGLTQEDRDYLEALVDGHDLASVLHALEQICREKAEHVLCNWQDKNTAKAWSHDAEMVAKAATRVVAT